MTKEILYHKHGGFDNDGNSHYWSEDTVIDLDNNTVCYIKEESFGGQLIANAPEGFIPNHYGVTKNEVSEFKAPTVEQEEAVYDAFTDIRNLFAKYPHRESLSFFKYWQEKKFIKNYQNAVEVLEDTDAHGENCSVDHFILPKKNLLIKVYYSKGGYGKTSRIEYKEETLK
jgi:hypothetical protein